jgi:hypothetical protein
MAEIIKTDGEKEVIVVEKKSKDTHSYKGWLNSDSFIKRSLAVAGYSIVGTLILYIPFAIFGILAAVAFIGISPK